MPFGETEDQYCRKSPRKSYSPLKEVASEETLTQKLKQINHRLFKDNEKMIRTINELNSRVHKFCKLNHSLNELIMGQGLEKLN
jgi:hypothetical protein